MCGASWVTDFDDGRNPVEPFVFRSFEPIHGYLPRKRAARYYESQWPILALADADSRGRPDLRRLLDVGQPYFKGLGDSFTSYAAIRRSCPAPGRTCSFLNPRRSGSTRAKQQQ